PRPRHRATHLELGIDAQGGLSIHAAGAVALLRAGNSHLRHRSRLQSPGRRLAARPRPSAATARQQLAWEAFSAADAVALDHGLVEDETEAGILRDLDHPVLGDGAIGPHRLPHGIALGIGEALR